MDIVNSLIQAIQEFNLEEAIYFAHLLQQETRNDSSNTIHIPIDHLFVGLTFGNDELLSLLCPLIWKTVKFEDYPVIIEKYKHLLIQGLCEVQDENVQKLCLRIVFELSNGIEIDTEILKCSLQLLVKSNYSVSSYLITLITNNSKSSTDISSLIQEISSNSPNDSVVKFRFLELFRKMNLEPSDSLYKTFFSELKSILNDNPTDSLLIANGLQVVQDCIYGREQFLLFQSEGIIDFIINTMTSNNGFLASKSIDLFSNFALLNCFECDFIELNGLDRKIIDLEDESKRESCLFCCAAFSTINFSNPQRLLNSFPEHLIHGTTSVQMAALHGLAIYFSNSYVPTDSKVHTLSFLIENINNFFKWLIEKTKSTFDEQKSAAYFTLKSILSSESCFKLVLNTTTILTDLLDRSLESSQVGLKWKYGILEQINANQGLFSCLNDPLKAQVTKYLGQGVTFVPKSTQVAFESAD